jgi:peptide-methionine (R)-S-oxide reductase
MMSRRNTLFSALGLGAVAAGLNRVYAGLRGQPGLEAVPAPRSYPFTRTADEWKQRLKPDAYYVLRQAGTERPGSSPLNKEKRAGVFSCAGCANPLFASGTKFESGTGWPSFWQPLDGAVVEDTDTTLFMKRTEVLCRECGGHLGHVFNDGPAPTRLRYCMKGVALNFQQA